MNQQVHVDVYQQPCELGLIALLFYAMVVTTATIMDYITGYLKLKHAILLFFYMSTWSVR
jgi:hypothetical protein